MTRRATAFRPASTSQTTSRCSRPARRRTRRWTSGTSRSSARSTRPHRWNWDELRALPSETITVDISCVTKWTKLDMVWEGVPVDALLDGVETSAEYVTAFCDGGYTTNLPLADVTDGKAWIAFAYDGEPLEPEHGGPARLLVPHLYFWKSAKWVRGLRLTDDRRARLLGVERLPHLRRPLEGTAVLGRLNWHVAEVADVWAETRSGQDARASTFQDWPGHRAGQHVDVRLTADDGYQAQRSYSIASPPGGPRVELTVERIDDGEVSPYLTEEAARGRPVRAARAGRRLLRLGRRSGWPGAARRRRVRHRPADGDGPATRGGAATRSRRDCSTRRGRWEDVIYRDELERTRNGDGLEIVLHAHAPQPPGWTGYHRRIDRDCSRGRMAPTSRADVHVRPDPVRRGGRGGLVGLGHAPARIKTERFGPTGG